MMTDTKVVHLFPGLREQPCTEVSGVFDEESRALLDSPLTNEELLDPIPYQAKCLGALCAVAEINERIRSLRNQSEITPEL